MDWQQMPPPLASSVPTSSYQSASPQLQQSPQLPHARPQFQQQQPSLEPPRPQVSQQRHTSQEQSQSPRLQQLQQNVQHTAPHRQHSIPRLTGSPVVAQSPKLPQQSNVKRLSSVGPRIDHAARVSASPRIPAHAGPTRSSSVSSTRSPAPAPGLVPHHADTNALLISVAEELFENARNSAFALADSMDHASLKEYQKMVATGLGCLEVVLGSHKLAPRVEARLQLRYASILAEETSNVMEAETALTKGITLCERNRFADLKYAMQFLQIKMLSQRRGKAAMISVDARIRDSEVMKHSHWTYAFRFLKASLYMQSANPAEAPALENLKAITTLAAQKGDRAVFVVATLLEGLSLLKTMKDDAIVRIQGCLAQVAKYQLEDSVHLMQTDILMLMLDLACSLHQKSPQIIAQKYGALQERLDGYLNNDVWGLSDTEMLVPIRKHSGSQYVISEDTAAILKPGSPNEDCDYLAMSFWSKLEAFTITYTYSGLGNLYKSSRNDKKISELWNEANSQLENNAFRIRGVPTSLSNAVLNANWRRELKAYLCILRGLHLATHSKWREVQKRTDELNKLLKPPLGNLIHQYSLYLSAAHAQGTGDLKRAMSLYSHSSFNLDDYITPAGSSRQAELEVSMLAMFNRIWIMQHPSYQDEYATRELLEQLRPLCADSPNLEIRTTYNLLLAAIQTNPPIPMTAIKTHISAALNGSKMLGDVQTLSIALCLMQAKLFQGIVGEQALKSARAASQQAKKCGNMLWMSVADGMLAVSLETQGQIAEASSMHAEASRYAEAVQAVMGRGESL
ncbi:cohesin loading factor-domain-containing protein [Microdochium bolleyi]|uniref:Cohesin loading factor-domain-containing protein n=1 Tax=Microdochium bolleyi TaxID=196109 RepID=A0A136J7H2_9PEZI|nr:cohesin loading factor-domain-containing protein [Microdochium bolleyi]